MDSLTTVLRQAELVFTTASREVGYNFDPVKNYSADQVVVYNDFLRIKLYVKDQEYTWRFENAIQFMDLFGDGNPMIIGSSPSARHPWIGTMLTGDNDERFPMVAPDGWATDSPMVMPPSVINAQDLKALLFHVLRGAEGNESYSSDRAYISGEYLIGTNGQRAHIVNTGIILGRRPYTMDLDAVAAMYSAIKIYNATTANIGEVEQQQGPELIFYLQGNNLEVNAVGYLQAANPITMEEADPATCAMIDITPLKANMAREGFRLKEGNSALVFHEGLLQEYIHNQAGAQLPVQGNLSGLTIQTPQRYLYEAVKAFPGRTASFFLSKGRKAFYLTDETGRFSSYLPAQ